MAVILGANGNLLKYEVAWENDPLRGQWTRQLVLPILEPSVKLQCLFQGDATCGHWFCKELSTNIVHYYSNIGAGFEVVAEMSRNRIWAQGVFYPELPVLVRVC